jgi:hypothetical protein
LVIDLAQLPFTNHPFEDYITAVQSVITPLELCEVKKSSLVFSAAPVNAGAVFTLNRLL